MSVWICINWYVDIDTEVYTLEISRLVILRKHENVKHIIKDNCIQKLVKSTLSNHPLNKPQVLLCIVKRNKHLRNPWFATTPFCVNLRLYCEVRPIQLKRLLRVNYATRAIIRYFGTWQGKMSDGDVPNIQFYHVCSMRHFILPSKIIGTL